MDNPLNQNPGSDPAIAVLLQHAWEVYRDARLSGDLPPHHIRRSKTRVGAVDLLTPGIRRELIAYLEDQLVRPLGVQRHYEFREHAIPSLEVPYPAFIASYDFMDALIDKGLTALSDRALLHLCFHIEIFGAIHALLIAQQDAPYWGEKLQAASKRYAEHGD